MHIYAYLIGRYSLLFFCWWRPPPLPRKDTELPRAAPSQSYGAPQTSYGAGQEEFPPQPYSFEYEVKDDEGNDYGHKEESDGSRVEGVYRVLLPDSRVQTVTYYVEGDSGFVADVQYEGEAQFPEDSQNGQYGAGAPNNGYGAPSPATGYGSPF
ncbi:Pro-resilin [Amphibalanus amphitrite]|uniref:Pro-resilin n=1 Tax=Amphibalanus amphitrite TaxID=1232801 RepID=A0A6A4X4J1_AMPAM|nr:Pro-resilin [Amphibalanus amphitrite]